MHSTDSSNLVQANSTRIRAHQVLEISFLPSTQLKATFLDVTTFAREEWKKKGEEEET
jgi:hypothetical protein